MSSVFAPIVAKGSTASERASAACEAMTTGLFGGAIFIHRTVPVAITGTIATSSQSSRRPPAIRGRGGCFRSEDAAEDGEERSEIVRKATGRRGAGGGSNWPPYTKEGGGKRADSIKLTS